MGGSDTSRRCYVERSITYGAMVFDLGGYIGEDVGSPLWLFYTSSMSMRIWGCNDE
jgi:hypothetical protein